MGSALFPDQRQRKSPKVPGTPVILGSFLIALLCGTLPAPHGPGGTPRRPRSAQPPERRRCPRQLEGNPWLLLVAPESSASGPGDGSGGAGEGLGLWEGASPSAGLGGGPRTYLFLDPGLAGCLGCGPAWHSPAPPRVSSASAQRQGARGRSPVRGHILRAAGAQPAKSKARKVGARAQGCGQPGRGGRRLETRALRGAPPRYAAAPSRFSLPLLLFHPVRPRFSSVPQ